MLGTSRDNLCPLVDTLASKQPQNSLKTASKWSFSKQFYKNPDRSKEEHRSSVKQHKYNGLTQHCISGTIGVMVSIGGSYPKGPWFNPRSRPITFFSFQFYFFRLFHASGCPRLKIRTYQRQLSKYALRYSFTCCLRYSKAEMLYALFLKLIVSSNLYEKGDLPLEKAKKEGFDTLWSSLLYDGMQLGNRQIPIHTAVKPQNSRI